MASVEYSKEPALKTTQPDASGGDRLAAGDEMSAPETRPVSAKNQPAASRDGIEGRLEFEKLLADLSARFVNLPSDQIDSQIKAAQRSICELLDLEQAALWQREEGGPKVFTLTHLHRTLEDPPPPERMIEDFFPWSRQQMLLGRVVALASLDELPPEGARDRESGQRFGIKSCLVLPLSVGGGPTIGIFGLNAMRVERDWPDALVKRLHLVAQIFANALARKRADQALRESEERMALAAEAGQVGIWVWTMHRNRVWGTEKWLRLFGFPPGADVSFEEVMQRIREEDRGMVQRDLQVAGSNSVDYAGEFRVVLPGGAERWIASRGRMHGDASGKPRSMFGAAIDLTERKQMEVQLRDRLQEIEELKQRVERENAYLQEEIGLLIEHKDIVGKSAAIKNVLVQAGQVAGTNSTVLLLGETGTGKELLARAIHKMSKRKDRALVTVNCASLPPTLIESELFGRERGAYTDALTRMAGRFELADESTLFLDEIGELPLEVQAKLLRVLEEGCFERLGSTKTLKADVRVIAATNRDLERAVKDGRFRQDLYYRLDVFPIRIPPLRERPEDVPLLVWAFVREFEKKIGKRIDRVAARSMESMQRYPWPGNVRELRNVIEHGMIVSTGNTLIVTLPHMDSSKGTRASDLDSIERNHILKVLAESGWRVGGKGGAAEILGLKRTTLQSLMKRLGIQRPQPGMPK
jgi:formate hydrogenlyase transcriptional activator